MQNFWPETLTSGTTSQPARKGGGSLRGARLKASLTTYSFLRVVPTQEPKEETEREQLLPKFLYP